MSDNEDSRSAHQRPEVAERESESSTPAFPIVGLGASAGGLEALIRFFDHMPSDSGMAFVVVTHRPAKRVSFLPALLSRHTRMQVTPVTDSIEIRPNSIYVGPPGAALAIRQRVLHVTDHEAGATAQLPIDFFFRSLAADQKDNAIGIVLSGTGSDGTLGLMEIKGASGMIMSQDERSARHSGMPHSAIATDMVDYVATADELPRQLLAYARGRFALAPAASGDALPEPDEAYDKLISLLRIRTGHDFSGYKRSTIRRRIQRRMSVHRVGGTGPYLRLLEANALEVDALFRELLIGVTSFFRDPAAFEALAGGSLAKLVHDKPHEEAVRVWVPGCSTGEEAFSLAILLREVMESSHRHFGVQIFATDLDARAIEVARGGLYGEGIVADVAPARLERFFTREPAGYRVRKEVREMVVFAPHNVLEDPPFTKLDLLSCRNLLIYLDAALQRCLFPIFHYALRPGGILFLGSSETVGDADLFTVVDPKWKLFRRKEVPSGTYIARFPATAPSETAPDAHPAPAVRPGPQRPGALAAEKVLLQTLVPPSVIINERGDAVYVHGRTGKFLEPAQGSQGAPNVLRMAREGLQLDMAAALRQAQVQEGECVRRGVRVQTDGDDIWVDLRVRRLVDPEAFRGLFLLSFERTSRPAAEVAVEGESPPDKASELERELQYAKEIHQGTVEALETANEELQSTNEELQSANEELQSTNEELETSKEEMHALNEELQTVNSELERKLEELSRVNDDMKNLLNGTEIATIFLDDQFRIKRYTERAKNVIRLIPSDVGRPIGDLVSNLHYDRLVEDAREVLHTLVFKEVEVCCERGTWYLMRILPYRTADNVIDGLVITFVEITKMKLLQQAAQRMSRSLELSSASVFALDAGLRYAWACGNPFGVPSVDLVGRTDAELFSTDDAAAIVALKRRALEGRRSMQAQVRVVGRGTAAEYHLILECLPPGSSADVMVGICALARPTEMPPRAEGER